MCGARTAGFELLQIGLEPIQTLLPDFAEALGPFGDVLDRRRLNAAGAPLRIAVARDEAGTLEHPQDRQTAVSSLARHVRIRPWGLAAAAGRETRSLCLRPLPSGP